MLFLDELSEFIRSSLEALRQPLEDGQVTIVRGQQVVAFPTRVMLVAAFNDSRVRDYRLLNYDETMRVVVPGVTLAVIG